MIKYSTPLNFLLSFSIFSLLLCTSAVYAVGPFQKADALKNETMASFTSTSTALTQSLEEPEGGVLFVLFSSEKTKEILNEISRKNPDIKWEQMKDLPDSYVVYVKDPELVQTLKATYTDLHFYTRSEIFRLAENMKSGLDVSFLKSY